MLSDIHDAIFLEQGTNYSSIKFCFIAISSQKNEGSFKIDSLPTH